MALQPLRQKLIGEVQIPSSLFQLIQQKNAGVRDLANQLNDKEQDTSSLFLYLAAFAIVLNASDIHLEAQEETYRVRLRLDGMLHDVTLLPKETAQALLSRIKLVSGLKLNVADRAQDGRLTILLPDNSPIESRVSALPSEFGESVVLRMLNPQNLKDIKDLGLRKDLLSLFLQEIKKPNGMIIVTGPTGSGKTTTLYAFLKEVQSPEIKTITIEDPIEYHLKGISQTQVSPNKNYTFALGLRAIVRQDPDVILVGEIRDRETAETAIQAALTGHLVFSTLHANDAAGTVARLLSLETKAPNIAAALNLIIAQRLVRKVCGKCRLLQKPTAQEFQRINRGLKGMSFSLRPKLTSLLKIARAKGCKLCNNTGYQGRIGIFEAILVKGDVESFIAKAPSIGEMRTYALKKGMVTMFQDGLLKIIEGITTIEEVERVTAE